MLSTEIIVVNRASVQALANCRQSIIMCERFSVVDGWLSLTEWVVVGDPEVTSLRRPSVSHCCDYCTLLLLLLLLLHWAHDATDVESHYMRQLSCSRDRLLVQFIRGAAVCA